jgi:hypothetical protein
MPDILDDVAGELAFGLLLCRIPNHSPANTTIPKIAPKPMSLARRRLAEVCSFMSAICMSFVLSWQSCAYRLFQRNVRRVNVKQHIGISRLDINVAALFSYDV